MIWVNEEKALHFQVVAGVSNREFPGLSQLGCGRKGCQIQVEETRIECQYSSDNKKSGEHDDDVLEVDHPTSPCLQRMHDPRQPPSGNACFMAVA